VCALNYTDVAVRFSAGTTDTFLRHSIQTSPWGATQLSIQYLPVPLSSGQERGTHHLSPFHAEVKNLWSSSSFILHKLLMHDDKLKRRVT
jgi:hypothetical protein